MASIEMLRSDLEAKLEASIAGGDLTQVEKLTAALQSIAEAEKLRLEGQNLQRGARSENLRFWIPVIAPTIGAFALVATLLFQIHQLNVNSDLQRAAEEGTELRDVIKSASLPYELAPIATTTRLRSFLLPSSPHSQEARNLAVVLLAATPEPAAFDFLLDGVIETTDRRTLDNFRDLVRLSGLLWEQWQWLDEHLTDLKKGTPRPSGPPPRSFQSPETALGPPSPQFPFPAFDPRRRAEGPDMNDPQQVEKLRDRVGDEIQQVGAAMVQILQHSPIARQVNMTDANFSYNDLKGLDLLRANLTRTSFWNSSVKDVDFGEVRDFDESQWTGTEWWQARKISPGLMAYLTKNYAFDSKTKYFGDPTDAGTYAKEVTRLQ